MVLTVALRCDQPSRDVKGCPAGICAHRFLPHCTEAEAGPQVWRDPGGPAKMWGPGGQSGPSAPARGIGAW